MAFDYPFGVFKLLTIVLSVLLLFMVFDYTFGIFKLLTIVLSVLLLFMVFDYTFGVFKLFSGVAHVAPQKLICSDNATDIFVSIIPPQIYFSNSQYYFCFKLSETLFGLFTK
jgi:hypothetical protein